MATKIITQCCPRWWRGSGNLYEVGVAKSLILISALRAIHRHSAKSQLTVDRQTVSYPLIIDRLVGQLVGRAFAGKMFHFDFRYMKIHIFALLKLIDPRS